MRNAPAFHNIRDRGAPIAEFGAGAARRLDAERGSRALLERQVMFGQYPCKIAGAE